MKSLIWPAVIIALAASIYVIRIQKEMVDFAVYRTAAARAMDAEPLYRAEDGHYQYKYFPAFAFVMAPFAKIDPEGAKAIWFALSVGLLSTLVRWSVRGLPERRLTERTLIWFSIILMGKFYAHELNLGQTNLLLGVLLTGALLSEQIEQPFLAGALVGLGIFVKPYAIILLPWLLLTSGLAGLGVALAVVAVGLTLPAAVYGWQGNLDQIVGWYRTVTDTTAPNLLVAENISLATMWAKWIGPSPLAAQLAVVTGLVVLGVAAWVMTRRKDITDAGYLEFGLLMLVVPLLSPQGWDYVLLLGTPAIVVLVDRWKEMTRPWRAITAVALFFMSFTIFDLLGRALYARMMRISIVSVCVLVLVACLANLRWRKLA